MQVLIATPLYPPDVGGPATYAKILEDELPSKNIATTVVSFGNVRHLPSGIRHFRYFLNVLSVARNADIVLALDPVSVGLPALVVSRLLHKRFIVKVVGDFAWEQYIQKTKVESGEWRVEERKSHRKNRTSNLGDSGGLGGGWVDIETFQQRRFGLKTELRRMIERMVARRAHRVIVPSAFLKKIVGLWGVREPHVRVVYNAFSPPEAALSKQDARRVLGISGTILISAGRLVPWKGFETLIRQMLALRGEFPDAHLFIAGDGPLSSELKDLVVDLGLTDHVTFLGRLDHDILFQYIIAADVFVLYTGYEGFSHQLLEVMSLGTPVVTTAVGGNLELIEDNLSGRLVAYGNEQALAQALTGLLAHPPAGAKFIAAAQKRASEFTVERMIEGTIHILRHVDE